MDSLSFQDNMKKYAKLLVINGINVQPGDSVILSIAVDQIDLARLIVQEAYSCGANEVIVQWSDDFILREKFLHASIERLENVPEYRVSKMNYLIKNRVSCLNICSSDPDALAGIDPVRLQKSNKANSIAFRPMSNCMQANKVSWTVAAAAGEAWAKKVFPGAKSSKEAVDLLWDQIFKSCRVYEDDPVLAWKNHEEKLADKANILNSEQFTSLHYTAPGTDLLLGLPRNHFWGSAGSLNEQGEYFIANMPTEEVFSAPDYRMADGYVTSTKPLSYSGNIIEGIKMVFKNGEIVKVSADKGEEVVRALVFENEGARHLGEVALVPDQSPISKSRLTFFNTLFDENASSHLAIGSAYTTCIMNGRDMSTKEELASVGLNYSAVHVDFMIGSNKMKVEGIRDTGSRTTIFRNGDWAI